MPEGPSIIILKESVSAFKGKRILCATGNAKIDMSLLGNQKIVDFKSWGKHFLICLHKQTIRIHFLLFGSYSINEQTKANPRLHLQFKKGSLYFYSCSVKLLEGNPDDIYDWEGDIMSDLWNSAKARKKLKALPGALIADALLDQNIFAGVGNIIKNEVLFRVRVQPGSKLGAIPPRKLGELIKEARNYSFDFLRWKKTFELRKHWLAHTKKMCPRCNIPLVRVQHFGKAGSQNFLLWELPDPLSIMSFKIKIPFSRLSIVQWSVF